jgi:hypothetical protein
MSLLAGTAATTGCNNDSRLKGGDPLTGGAPAIPTRTEATAIATTSAPKNAVPPLPAPSSATSNAALAGGAFQSLDPTRDLHIGNGQSGLATGGANATLNAPQPIAERTATGQLTSDPKQTQRTEPQAPATIQPVSGPAGASTDALLAMLQARGVTFYRVEAAADNSGDIRFSCAVPNPTNPNIRRMYEAHGPDQRSAMLAVIAQMDQERR